MSRYINADIALEDVRTLAEKHHMNGEYEFANGILKAITRIKSQPTADVKEVVRGEWINRKGGFGSEYDNCSVCHKDSPSDTKTRFCPYCGADMREGADNE